MLNRYAKLDVFHHLGLVVAIQRYGRVRTYTYSYVQSVGKRPISMHSVNRLQQIAKQMEKKVVTDEYDIYEWQPPTLVLIPYQCGICNEVIWSTNEELWIKHYCEQSNDMELMVKKNV